MFAPFFKNKDSDSRNLNATSPGLGLNIFRQIAKVLNGEIKFTSTRAKGSTLTFEFLTEGYLMVQQPKVILTKVSAFIYLERRGNCKKCEEKIEVKFNLNN